MKAKRAVEWTALIFTLMDVTILQALSLEVQYDSFTEFCEKA
jgi:hypothetical protein